MVNGGVPIVLHGNQITLLIFMLENQPLAVGA
jgi:hypothetical protein